MQNDTKLEICKQTRKYTADTLYKVLKDLLSQNKPISEILLRDTWLAELRKNPNIFPDGWYIPPPHGIIVLFADDQNKERVSYKTARPAENWPKDDIFLNRKNGIIYLYASPVDRKTGIIGDFGITLYFGKNQEIKDLLKLCLKLDIEIFEYSKEGMYLSDVAIFAEKRMENYGMQNEIVTITDKDALKNKSIISIGHTIPGAYEDWNSEEEKILENGIVEWESAKDMISNKRLFVNSVEHFKIKKGCTFTIEPRAKLIKKPHLPASLSYHTIAIFNEDGSKELITNFNELFTLAGTDYLLN